MADFMTRIKNAVENRADYHRTMAKLRAMPLQTMIDFDIAPNDFRRIARDSVYGK